MERQTRTQQTATEIGKTCLAPLALGQHAFQCNLRALVVWQRRRVGTVLLLALFLLSSTLGLFVQNGGVAMAAPTVQRPQVGTGSHAKNTLAAVNLTDQGNVARILPGQAIIQTSQPTPSAGDTIQRPTGVTMRPLLIPLSVGASAQRLGSDGLLDVTAPVGAVTAATVAKAQAQATTERAHGLAKLVTPGGASLALQVTEVAGPSGGSDSGRVTLGTYLFTLVDAYGQRVPTALSHSLNVTFHLPTAWRGAGFDLGHLQFIVNGAVPTSALPLVNGRAQALGTPVTEAVTLGTGGALNTIIPATSTGGGSSSGTFNTNTPNARWQAQTDTGVDLSTGDLTYSYPLDVPSGPGGLAPQLTLSYNSGSVNDNHNLQAASGWLGEGWDLSLGAITWGESNVTSDCSSTCGNTWENSWQFSDPYGDSGEIIPQDNDISTWYDDTTNPAPTVGHDQWFLNDNNQVKIFSYTNPNQVSNFPSGSLQPPCFRAFLPNGYMEEFGCTPDSLGFYVDDNSGSGYYKGNFPYQWNLDMIVDPNGNQIHISYTRYQNYDKNNGAVQFPIDTELGTITYDSPSCHNTSTMCTGSSWQPQVKIVFNSATTATRLTGAACPTFTNTTTYLYHQTMRCDDVQDLSNGGKVNDLPAPTLQALAILNDVAVQVSTSGSSPTWQTLRDYQFSYDQSANTTITDPLTNEPESIAGYLDLTQIQEVGDDGATMLPPLTMTYTSLTDYYIDNYYHPASNSLCGPAWNTGQGSGCALLTSVTGRYLTNLSNGQGWTESYTFTLARNNTHGVDTGLTANDPFACTNATATQQAASPCNEVDDQNWSRQVLTNRTASVLCVELNGNGCGVNNTSTLSTSSSYAYTLAQATAKECSNCLWDMYWGNQNDGDKLDYYNAHLMGFAKTFVTNPDGSVTVESFDSTEGYGVATSSITCYSGNGCAVDPWTDPANALHGRLTAVQDYDTPANGGGLLKQTVYIYDVTCPPNGIGGSPGNTNPAGEYVGQRTSELDINNPVVYCEIRPAATTVYLVDGGSVSSSPTTITTNTYSYDGHDHLTKVNQSVVASDAAATPTIVSNTWEAWDDALTIANTSATGTYFIEQPAVQDTEDGSGHVKACAYTGYDGGTVGAKGSVSTLKKGLVSETTQYSTNCTTGSLSGPISTKRTYNSNGDLLATQDADAVAGVSGHTTTACTYSSVTYTACAGYDSLYSSQVASVTNDLAQTSGLGYQDTSGSSTTPAAGNGWGQWLSSMTDANGQKTLFEYDPLGRLTASVKPGAAYGDTWTSPTTSDAYPITCAATGAQEPCAALTTTQQLGSGDTTTSATYYDGWGRPVETVTPSSLSGTTCTVSVAYTAYDASGRTAFVSDPYFSTIANDASCAPSYFRPDSTQPGTTTTYDVLGRVLTTTDALSETTTTTYTQGAPTGGANISDSATYEATTVVDANGHQTRTLVDGLGHTRYVEQFTGTSGSYALEGTTQQNYDWLGNVVSVYEPNVGTGGGAGLSTTAQTTVTYNLISQATSAVDADLGTQTATYDANGNVTTTVDARGASGTIYAGYDGLNRQVWRNTTNSATGAYVTYGYDSTAGGNLGVGQLTSETFNNSNTASGLALLGSYTYTYDDRGEVTGSTLTVDGTGYATSATYDDAGQPLTQTSPNGDVVTTSYTGQGWLGSLSLQQQGGPTTTLLNDVSYSGVLGATGTPTGAQWDNGTYTYSASADALLRPTNTQLTLTSGGATLYQVQPSYDADSNVIGVATTLATGTDTQAFCYDDLNRLTWAGSTGTPPCGGSLTAGTLTSANYTQLFSYDAMNRLTSGPSGSYSYGDSSHPDAATSIGSAYTAAYDAVGDMVCRAPTASATCAGSPSGSTGAGMTYDNEGRLVGWQNTPTSPTTTDTFLYDGEGNRIEQVVQQAGVGTTDTVYAGGLEEVTTTTPTSGSPTTSTTAYYGNALSVNGTLSFLASDTLGSAEEALNTSGQVTASQLYTPYGDSRYSTGTFPTDQGFTGYRADSVTGLDYANARYYDPEAGQFISADSVIDGLSRYAYVGGNPTSRIDPSGHLDEVDFKEAGGGTGAGGGGGGFLGLLCLFGGCEAAGGVAADGVMTFTSEEGDGMTLVSQDDATTGTETDWYENSGGDTVQEVDGQWVVEDDAAQTQEDEAEKTAEEDQAQERNAEANAQQTNDETGNGNTGNTGNAGCGESFAPTTLVATPHGKQHMASLVVGSQVVAYNPKTGKTATETVQHVFIDHDTDLLDVTLRVTPTRGPPTKTAKGQPSQSTQQPSDETVHTTASHPWLTADRGFVRAGTLHLGEQVVRADGTTATVVGLRVIPGAASMWDLTVSTLHTFAVGMGAYVVHNCGSGSQQDPYEVDLSRGRYPETASHIEDSINQGQPDTLEWDSAQASANRRASLQGVPTMSGFDRDEYPLASTDQGGIGADIRYIDPADNRGAGSFIRQELGRVSGVGVNPIPLGTWFKIIIVP